MQKKRLDESRYFPYVAWTTIVLFVVFTFTLVVELSDTHGSVNAQVSDNRAD